MVSALAIETETLELCRDRQKLVAEIIKAEGAIAKALEREDQKRGAKGNRTPVKSVAQLASLVVKEAVADKGSGAGGGSGSARPLRQLFSKVPRAGKARRRRPIAGSRCWELRGDCLPGSRTDAARGSFARETSCPAGLW